MATYRVGVSTYAIQAGFGGTGAITNSAGFVDGTMGGATAVLPVVPEAPPQPRIQAWGGSDSSVGRPLYGEGSAGSDAGTSGTGVIQHPGSGTAGTKYGTSGTGIITHPAAGSSGSKYATSGAGSNLGHPSGTGSAGSKYATSGAGHRIISATGAAGMTFATTGSGLTLVMATGASGGEYATSGSGTVTPAGPVGGVGTVMDGGPIRGW